MQQLNNNQRRLILYLYTRDDPECPISSDQLRSNKVFLTHEELSILEEMKYLQFNKCGDFYYFHLLPGGQAAYERFQREIEEYCEKRNDIDVATKMSKQSNRISLCALVIAALAFIFSVFAFFCGS